MKKILTLFAAITMCATVANAQPEPSDNKREARHERFANASPEQKAHMAEIKKKFDALTPEQKEAVKKERERHRQEMKKITGFDSVLPASEGR